MTVGKLAMTVSKNPNAKERLEKIITALETAEKTVEGVKTKLVDVSDEQRLQKKAKALAVSANALLAPLTKLSNQVSELDASLVQVKSDLAEAIQAIALWKKLGPLIVTVVLIWIGIAQFCLFRCGKALLHSANPQEN